MCEGLAAESLEPCGAKASHRGVTAAGWRTAVCPRCRVSDPIAQQVIAWEPVLRVVEMSVVGPRIPFVRTFGPGFQRPPFGRKVMT